MHTLSGIVIGLKMSSALVTIARDCVASTDICSATAFCVFAFIFPLN